MKGIIFSEGNGYGHAARDSIISERFGLPIMTFGKGAEYCKKNDIDLIEIPAPYAIQTAKEKTVIVTNYSELVRLLKPGVVASITAHFKNAEFVIVDGSPLGLALAYTTGKKAIYITNDTAALVGVQGLMRRKVAASLLNRLLSSASSIIVPDFPPPLTITMRNMNISIPLTFSGPLIKNVPQRKHKKKYVVVGPLEKELSPLLGNQAIYGSQVSDLRSYYGDAKLVICHGGHTTMMEALSLGKPLLCIVDGSYPERMNNVEMAEKHGVGVKLDRNHLSKESLRSAIEYSDTLDTKRLALYKKSAKRSDPLAIIKKII